MGILGKNISTASWYHCKQNTTWSRVVAGDVHNVWGPGQQQPGSFFKHFAWASHCFPVAWVRNLEGPTCHTLALLERTPTRKLPACYWIWMFKGISPIHTHTHARCLPMFKEAPNTLPFFKPTFRHAHVRFQNARVRPSKVLSQHGLFRYTCSDELCFKYWVDFLGGLFLLARNRAPLCSSWLMIASRLQKLNTNIFPTFRAPRGYPCKMPGYPAGKSVFPERFFWGTHRTFWPLLLHTEDPHPTRRYPHPKFGFVLLSLVWVSQQFRIRAIWVLLNQWFARMFVSGLWGTHWTFWPPPLHADDPHPTGSYPDPKVWVCAPFSCLRIEMRAETEGRKHLEVMQQ